MKFDEKLVYLRKKRGMTQEDLADKLNLSRQAVYKWETGQSMPDIDNLKLLAGIFKVTIDFLLDDEKTMTATPKQSIPLGVVHRSSLTPENVNADRENLKRSKHEKSQLKIRGALLRWFGAIAVVALIISILFFIGFWVESKRSADTLMLNIAIVLLVIGVVFGIVWLCCYQLVYKSVATSRSQFFNLKKSSEAILNAKHYWYEILQDDLPVWFFFDPVEKVFGFYFRNQEQFVCPIQNYLSMTYSSSGRGIIPGDAQTKIGIVAGDIQGVSIDSQTTYVHCEDTLFNFTIFYLDHDGTDNEYSYKLSSVRTYTDKLAHNSVDMKIVLMNGTSHSTIAAYNRIKSKLDIEKEKINEK